MRAAPTDTIVAISTPPGKGGIGIVRLSGPNAAAIAERLFRPAGAPSAPDAPGGEERARFGRFLASGGEPIDHGYLCTFGARRSFTGEETAELSAHGSPAVLRALVEAAVEAGARPATPGEFTLRAFLNGRIDLTQAEAIRDLIEARTAFAAKVAFEQVNGRVSSEVDRLKESLADLVARVEAGIEFSEEAEADRFAPAAGLIALVSRERGRIEALAGTFERGRRVRDGFRVALVGAPNAGKSSLFNRVLEEDRAIVTAIAGTTRDLLEETLDLDGVPVVLVDTAGLHDSKDAAGAEAVRRARTMLEEADHLVVVLDWSRALRAEEKDLLRSLEAGRATVLLNKVDLGCGVGRDQVLYLRKRHEVLEVSAKSGEGIPDLRRRLGTIAAGAGAPPKEETFLTNLRHRDLLLKAAKALARALGAARDGIGDEYLVIDLQAALDHLGEITGDVGIDGIYDRIFKNFCIGK